MMQFLIQQLPMIRRSVQTKANPALTFIFSLPIWRDYADLILTYFFSGRFTKTSLVASCLFSIRNLSKLWTGFLPRNCDVSPPFRNQEQVYLLPLIHLFCRLYVNHECDNCLQKAATTVKPYYQLSSVILNIFLLWSLFF